MANNPFKMEEKHYYAFPNDEYVDCCILSFQTADLKPGPMADTNDPVPSCRFLFGGYIKDESGQIKVDETGAPIIARKWSKWMRRSNNQRAAIMNFFDSSKQGFPNLWDILQDFEATDGKIWTTPVKIILEQSGDYQNILRVKPGNNKQLNADVFYDDKYIPYKVVKAYGDLAVLSLAACKFRDGVKVFEPDDMVEPTDDNG